MIGKIFIALIIALSVNHATAEKSREERIFPVFQVVKFRNSACAGPSKNGTCYTEAECAAKGGTAEGSCSSGYGVCCTFTKSCGQTSAENCTYFESTTPSAGACTLKVCKCSDNICQLRLDFNQFVITGPSTDSATTGIKGTFGVQAKGGEKDLLQASQCLTDTFSVTNPSGTYPPMICGINTGEHMYVDASDSCNDLAFQLGTTAAGTTIATRQWSIKISQYACNYNNLAPDGCTQYFFGSSVDTVRTYNYDGGQHLANQEQQICVRRERGQCRICWAAMSDTDFMVSGDTAIAKGYTKESKCCGYGTDGKDSATGYDCVSIPGAKLGKTTSKSVAMGPKICGRSKGLVSATGTAAGTVCSFRTPFYIRFISDNWEHMNEGKKTDKGFQLTYIQSSTGC